MENRIVEHLIRCAEKVAIKEKEYRTAKQDYELLKAQYILCNNWEKILGKKKPTVAEKEAYIELETEVQRRRVNELRLEVEYCKRIYEINIMSQKY